MQVRRRGVPWFGALCAMMAAACGDDPGTGDGDPIRSESLIRADRYTRLVLEVDAVPDRELRAGVGADLAAGFATLVDKPDGIDFVDDGALTAVGAEHAWTIDELDELAGRTFDLAAATETIKVHVLLVDGRYASEDGVVLGIAWANQNLALFVDSIEDTCGTLLPALLRDQGCAAAQLAIATHELGHVIGLVDNGVPMQSAHRSADHGAHDASDDCVMYWSYDGTAAVDTVTDDVIAGGDGRLGFDDACLADLAAVRDR